MMITAITPILCNDFSCRVLQSSLIKTNSELFQRIIIHDCPPSRKCNQASKYEAQFSNVTLINSGGSNIGHARNLGLEVAHGDWVVFWDADDIQFPDAITRLVPVLESNKNEVIVCRYATRNLMNRTVRLSHKFVSSQQKNAYDISLEPGLWRFIIPSYLAKKIRFPEINIAEDQVYLARILTKGLNLNFYNGITYEYAENHSSQVTSNPIESNSLIKAIDLMSDVLKDLNNPISELIIRNMRLKLVLSYITRIKELNLNTFLTLFYLVKTLGPRDLFKYPKLIYNFGKFKKVTNEG